MGYRWRPRIEVGEVTSVIPAHTRDIAGPDRICSVSMRSSNLRVDANTTYGEISGLSLKYFYVTLSNEVGSHYNENHEVPLSRYAGPLLVGCFRVCGIPSKRES